MKVIKLRVFILTGFTYSLLQATQYYTGNIRMKNQKAYLIKLFLNGFENGFIQYIEISCSGWYGLTKSVFLYY